MSQIGNAGPDVKWMTNDTIAPAVINAAANTIILIGLPSV
jgi:hypothetical protein